MKKESQAFYEHIHKEYWNLNVDEEKFEPMFSDRVIKSRFLISALRPKKILNVGFESIKIASFIVSDFDFEEYVLIDIDENLCDIPKEFSVKGYRALNIDVSSDKLPFPNNYFDLVFAGEVIEHLWNPDFAFREMYRVTRVGGNILLTTPNLASWYNRLLLLVGLTPINVEVSTEANLGRRFKFLGNKSPPVGHIRLYTMEAIKELMASQGITDFRLSGYKREDVRLDSLFAHFTSLASGFVLEVRKSP